MKIPDTEFATDFKSLLPIPSIYIDWEGIYLSVFSGWLFWNIKLEWEKNND